MNMIEAFNKTAAYIETTLADEIDEKKIAQLSGYSFPMFSRIFSILTDTTLTEYIRYRKLTQSARDLRETSEKIMDVAVKYGYESADSFGNAFKKFHGFTPSEIRNGKPYRVVSRVQLALSIRGGSAMNVTIQKKPAFKVAGLNVLAIENSLCPQVWDDLFAKYDHDELSKLGSGQNYGICHDVQDSCNINYMAGYDVTDVEKAEAMSLDLLEVAEAEYAVVELQGRVPECIHEGWKYVMEVFFPEHGYQHSGAPDFEVYSEGDMQSGDYAMELWVPVVRG